MATEHVPEGRRATEGVARGLSWRHRAGSCLPAILLLLSEQPGYGYGLVPRLNEFTSATSIARRSTGPWPSSSRMAWCRSRRRPPAGQSRRVVLGDAAGGAGTTGVDGGHQGGARPPRTRSSPLSSDRHDRRGPVRGRRGMGARTGPGLWPVSTTSMWRRRLMPPDNENDDTSPFADLAGDRWIRTGRTPRTDCRGVAVGGGLGPIVTRRSRGESPDGPVRPRS